MNKRLSPETLTARTLGDVDPASGALAPRIYPSTIYAGSVDGSHVDGEYAPRSIGGSMT
jgi:hypothetical protein